LAEAPLTYNDIIVSIGLQPLENAGKFVHHLKTLVNAGIVEKDGSTYKLTSLGQHLAKERLVLPS